MNIGSRLQWKVSLVRSLYERGYSRDDVLQLFRLIDWIMVLPEELARGFKQVVRSYEEADRMRYVTSIERLAIEEGIQRGIEQGIEQGILETNRRHIIQMGLSPVIGTWPCS